MWSNPDAKWDEFQPVQYLLDTKKVLSLPFVRLNERNRNEAVQTTLGDILRETANWQIKNAETGLDFGRSKGHQIAISADQESLVLASGAFNCQLLKTLLDFRSVNVDPFDAVWFWYGEAEVLDDPHTSYSFFVVHNNKIVNDRVKFSDAPGYGFDPSVFDTGDTSEIWSDEKGWNDAELRYWYRRFYQDTITGQLMVLRSDEPELFHYPEGQHLRVSYSSAAASPGDADDSDESKVAGNDDQKQLTSIGERLMLSELARVKERLGKIQMALWLMIAIGVVWLFFLR